MSQCIVHFGMPKTGSTSIQATLLAASPLPGTTFLNVGVGNSSRVLATLFMDRPQDFHLNRKWDVPQEQLDQESQAARATLDQQIQASGGQRCLISAEVISTLSTSALRRMKAWLDERFDDVQLVGYVRAPMGYMASELQQKIKAGQGMVDLAKRYPAYRQRFGKMEEVFGRERIRYWKFDPARFPGNDVVADFLQRLALEVPASAFQRSNESLSRDGLALLYIYRKLGPGYGTGRGSVEENRRMQRYLRQVGGPRIRLSTEVVRPILQAQADDIAWMESRLGESLAEPPGAAGADAIAGEDDLLRPSLAALAWLAAEVGQAVPDAQALPAPEQVAQWMHQLREKIATGGRRGKLKDNSALVQMRRVGARALAQQALHRTGLASDISVADAQAAVQQVMDALRDALSAPAVETVEVAGLGHFQLRPKAAAKARQAGAGGAWAWSFSPSDDPAPTPSSP